MRKDLETLAEDSTKLATDICNTVHDYLQAVSPPLDVVIHGLSSAVGAILYALSTMSDRTS